MTIFYHPSNIYQVEKILIFPKVPNPKDYKEEGDIPRISFNTHLVYCLRSLIPDKPNPHIDLILSKFKIHGHYYNPAVYIATSPKEIFLPPNASDFRINNEYWAVDKTCVSFIGYLCLDNLTHGRLKLVKKDETLDCRYILDLEYIVDYDELLKQYIGGLI